MHQVIHIHAAAPPKPATGQACNGCGVCCASEPCPLGVIASGRRHGACAALKWKDDGSLYRCGLIDSPEDCLPAALRWSAPLLAPLIARVARRYIAAGAGCDADVTV